MPDVPNTPKEIMEAMPSVFNSEKAQGLKATFQFELSGEGGGTWVVDIADGKCQVREGNAESPNVVIGMSVEDYVAMAKGQLEAMRAFMAGKIKVKGDVNLAAKIPTLFQL